MTGLTSLSDIWSKITTFGLISPSYREADSENEVIDTQLHAKPVDQRVETQVSGSKFVRPWGWIVQDDAESYSHYKHTSIWCLLVGTSSMQNVHCMGLCLVQDQTSGHFRRVRLFYSHRMLDFNMKLLEVEIIIV